jgi:hypothetical protein
MPTRPDTYGRARIEMLNYLLNFSTAKYFGPKTEGYEWTFNSVECSWRGGVSDEQAPIGSLCMLSSAPFTKFYLCWLIDFKDEGYGGSYLMQSVEDHSLCWWSNVGVYFFPPEKSKHFPQWKWSDRQFEFYDRWLRAAKRVDDYWTKTLLPDFHDDGSVTLGTREHIFRTAIDGEGGYLPKKTFPDWRKVKFGEMVEFFKYCVSSNPKNKQIA